jgi:uncharacterized protein YneR
MILQVCEYYHRQFLLKVLPFSQGSMLLNLNKVGVNMMIISIDEKAFSWFNKEFELSKPFSIRMFPQYAGFGEKHKGYSLAFSAEAPTSAGFTNEMDGITFFVEDNDIWFFDETKTYLSIDPKDELKVTFMEELNSAIN